jgi:enoyl-CoA hydratase/carnithine racemase
MSVLEWKKDDAVAIITMTNGENRLNPVFNQSMLDVLQEIEEDQTISAVVIQSNDPKCWSLGIDLNWIQEKMNEKDFPAMRGFLYGLNDVFKKILLYPVPVIACIGGHCVAGGAILACVCDFRFMRSDRGFFFFSEIDVNIPFLPGMIALVKRAVPYYKFNEMLLSGYRYGASEMEKHHVIQKACENEEELMKETLAFAQTFKKNRGTFREIKKRLHSGIIEVFDKEDPAVIEPLALVAKD